MLLDGENVVMQFFMPDGSNTPHDFQLIDTSIGDGFCEFGNDEVYDEL